MKTTIAIAVTCLLLCSAAAPATAPDDKPAATTKSLVMDVAWQKHADNVEFVPSTQPGKKADVLKITGPGTTRVLVIDNPKLAHHTYAIVGRVKYENVKGTGYLEMWSTFPDGGAYFSRTLGSGGPMQTISGSSDWRPFLLPFFAQPGMLPSRIEVNVVLPEGGVVYLEPAQLVQELDETGLPKGFKLPPAASSNRASPNAWWSDRAARWMGAIAGTVLGVLGGLVGMLAGRGKARRLVFALLMTILIIGGTSLVLGIVALGMGQPYGVYYPLLLSGVIATLLPLVLMPQLRRRYEELELRRMTALDATS